MQEEIQANYERIRQEVRQIVEAPDFDNDSPNSLTRVRDLFN